MARIRTIKPEFWTSDQITDCSPLARLLFIGLWNFCDDAGRHVASVKRVKMEIFPADEISGGEIRELIDELIRAELILEYDAIYNGKTATFWAVTGWHNQKIEKRTVRYPSPKPEGNSASDRRTVGEESPNGRRMVADRSTPESNGMETNGMETNQTGDIFDVAVGGVMDLGQCGIGKPEGESHIEPPKRNGKPDAKAKLERFEAWWLTYPLRDGKRRYKADAREKFLRIDPEEWPLLERATANYSADLAKQGLSAMDAKRWLSSDRWRDALREEESAVSPHVAAYFRQKAERLRKAAKERAEGEARKAEWRSEAAAAG